MKIAGASYLAWKLWAPHF